MTQFQKTNIRKRLDYLDERLDNLRDEASEYLNRNVALNNISTIGAHISETIAERNAIIQTASIFGWAIMKKNGDYEFVEMNQ